MYSLDFLLTLLKNWRMEIISRLEAIKKGQNWYFTGNICKNGHLCKRYVKNWVCSMCKLQWEKAKNYHYNPNKQRAKKLRFINKLGKEVFKERNKKYDIKYRANLSDSRRQELKEYIRDWARNKARNDSTFRLCKNIRTSIWYYLKKAKTSKSRKPWEIFVNFTITELVSHLEKQFDSNMNWDNYGSYWHVDHIKPLSKFKLPDEMGLAWNLDNLQPLEGIENIRKSNKYIE